MHTLHRDKEPFFGTDFLQPSHQQQQKTPTTMHRQSQKGWKIIIDIFLAICFFFYKRDYGRESGWNGRKSSAPSCLCVRLCEMTQNVHRHHHSKMIVWCMYKCMIFIISKNWEKIGRFEKVKMSETNGTISGFRVNKLCNILSKTRIRCRKHLNG